MLREVNTLAIGPILTEMRADLQTVAVLAIRAHEEDELMQLLDKIAENVLQLESILL